MTQETKKIYMGNLSYSVTREEIKEFLAGVGEVIDIALFEDKGFAFVEFTEAASTEKAVNELGGQDFKGRPVKIDFARPKQRDDRRF